ncbi:hypothetical protein LTR85_012151 [Meristemomyces frigidus]|nr:hypothetical protein LTR85_012151 [Meristemomyces frigidus]
MPGLAKPSRTKRPGDHSDRKHTKHVRRQSESPMKPSPADTLLMSAAISSVQANAQASDGSPPEDERRSSLQIASAVATVLRHEICEGIGHVKNDVDDKRMPGQTVEPQSAAVIPLASGLVNISKTELVQGMNALWTSLDSTTRNMVKGEANNRAVWASEPHKDLLRLYQHLFNADCTSRVLKVMRSGTITCKQVLEACLAVAIFDFVFDRKLSIDGPREMLSSLRTTQQ